MKRRALFGLLAAGAASLAVTAALAGNGVGGIFNLGQVNTVDAMTQLRGARAGDYLNVTNTSSSKDARAVTGASNAGTGVFGYSNTRIGVRAAAGAATGLNYGIYGSTASPAGFAGYFRNLAATTTATNGRGIRVLGARGTDALFPAGNFAGAGEFAGPNGVVGYATFDGGAGLAGFSRTHAGIGVYGATTEAWGVPGDFRNLASTAKGPQTAVRGLAYGATEADLFLVSGLSMAAGEFGGRHGVIGSSVSSDGAGVIAMNRKGGRAIFAWGTSEFRGNSTVDGDLRVTGKVTKASGTFRIDHPLDPENRYLSHSFVESPDMKNIYDGVVVTDAEGRAVVELPDYFEALNRDPRYQLTAIGSFSPVQIAEEVSDNRFVILSKEPGVKVSWQVTGIRRDAYAVQNPIAVEEDKAVADRGRYLHPEAFGKPASLAIGRDAEIAALAR